MLSRSAVLALVLPSAIAIAGLIGGCEGDPKAARTAVSGEHVPKVIDTIRDDIRRHRAGLREAAGRLGKGFIVEDPAQRERDMRFALRYVQEPPKGINELIVSPMSFLAAVDANGKVIARDLKKADEDQMKGEDFAAKFPVVRRALEDGIATEGLVTFDATDDKAKPPASYSMLFVAPARVAGKVVGALVAGIPLWRWSQRLSTQGQLELTKEPSAIYWVFAWKGDQLFPPKQGLEFDALLPDAAARKAGLAASPRGFMGKAQQYDRWYVYGVLPVPSIASDAGFIVVRGEPLE